MGSEFFWFYDIFVVAIAAAIIFHGAKKGAVGVLISSVSAILAFVIAFFGCGIISEKLYDSLIREHIEDYMEERLGSAINTELIEGLSDVQMLKTKVGDLYLQEVPIEYDERSTAMIDLSAIDLTETGLENADLTGFGLRRDLDLSLVKVGHITVTRDEVKKYGIGNIVLAKVIASNLSGGSVFTAFRDVGNKMAETVSPSLKGLGSDLAAGSTDAIYSFVVSIITAASGTLGDRIMDDIVTPTVKVPLQAIVFCILFALVMLILGIIANASKIINKIPIVSSVNGFLGAVLGLLEAAVVIILVCVIIRMLIALCGTSLVFINEQTISKTFIFRYIYNIDVFDILTKLF